MSVDYMAVAGYGFPVSWKVLKLWWEDNYDSGLVDPHDVFDCLLKDYASLTFATAGSHYGAAVGHMVMVGGGGIVTDHDPSFREFWGEPGDRGREALIEVAARLQKYFDIAGEKLKPGWYVGMLIS